MNLRFATLATLAFAAMISLSSPPLPAATESQVSSAAPGPPAFAARAPDGELDPNDLRISDMGPDGHLSYRADDAAVVYDSIGDRYLVVWTGDDDSGALIEDEDEIFGQLLDGASGAELPPNDFRISFAGGTGNSTYAAGYPDVAFDHVHQRFLVVWEADTDDGDLVDGEKEIWGQILDGALGTVGSNFRISTMGPDGNGAFDAERPAVAFNPVRDEFLVVWEGDTNTGGLVDNEREIWAQLVSHAAALVGSNLRVSDMGGTGTSDYWAHQPDVVFNTRDFEYLIVWAGTDDTGELVAGETEIYAQRADQDLGGLGANDARLSDMGGVGDPNYGARDPAVAYNPIANEYLAVWAGTDNVGGLVAGEDEIFSQRMTATLGGLGGNDYRLTDIGGIGNPTFQVWGGPAIAFNPKLQRYLVVWNGNDTVDGMSAGEIETFAQLVTWDIVGVGPNDGRISDVGGLGSSSCQALGAAVAANTRHGEFLAAFDADDTVAPQVDNEREILVQRVDGLAIFIDGLESGDTTNWSSHMP